MRLKLRYPAIHTSARYHAGLAVRLAAAHGEVDLDYTPGSLGDLDWFVGDIRGRGLSPTDVPEALFVLGCYVGEVMVRNLKGVWLDTARSACREMSPWPMVVVLPDGTTADPIGAVFRRLTLGESEYVPVLYARAAASHRSRQRLATG